MKLVMLMGGNIPKISTLISRAKKGCRVLWDGANGSEHANRLAATLKK